MTPQEERTHTRDLTYSAWHRTKSTARFIGSDAYRLGMIDIDDVEYDVRTSQPVALIETARDIGQFVKTTTLTCNLARLAGIAAYVVLYKAANIPNASDPSVPDIAGFRVKQLVPKVDQAWACYTPKEYANFLLCLRTGASQ